MSDAVHERLKEARARAGFSTAREAADHHKWSYSTYASHEGGVRGVRPDAAERYAKAFRVSLSWLLTGEDGRAMRAVVSIPVVGVVAAGTWLEEDEITMEHGVMVPAIPDLRFPAEYQIALRVRGNSMNRVIRDGAYAVGVLYEHARPVQNNDIVAVRRHRSGLVEITLKRYKATDDGGELCPESDDPRYQEPVVLHSEDDETSVEIFALVIGAYTPFV